MKPTNCEPMTNNSVLELHQFACERFSPILAGHAVIASSQLQWLVACDERQMRYTNWGDGRPGDVSELVDRVNASPTLNHGHNDWRVPTIDELQTLVGADASPKDGWYWSSSSYQGLPGEFWVVDFSHPGPGYHVSTAPGWVRLVRTRN